MIKVLAHTQTHVHEGKVKVLIYDNPCDNILIRDDIEEGQMIDYYQKDNSFVTTTLKQIKSIFV